MTTASDAIVRAYLEAVQAARRTPAAPEVLAVGCGPSS
jgi:hypothetical protein